MLFTQLYTSSPVCSPSRWDNWYVYCIFSTPAMFAQLRYTYISSQCFPTSNTICIFLIMHMCMHTGLPFLLGGTRSGLVSTLEFLTQMTWEVSGYHTWNISSDFCSCSRLLLLSCRASPEWDNDCWGCEGGGVQHWDGGKVALGETLFGNHSRNLSLFWTRIPQYSVCSIVLHKVLISYMLISLWNWMAECWMYVLALVAKP